MLKYGNYNITVDGSRPEDRHPNRFGNWEPGPHEPWLAYERRVLVQLDRVGVSGVGGVVLQSLYPRVPVYIVPYHGGRGACNAITGQWSSDIWKGIRVQYSPEQWEVGGMCGGGPGYGPDETLLHELVHAARFTHNGFAGMKHHPLALMQDPEEMLAVMVTNMYRSERGFREFNRSYLRADLLNQDELEQFLASRRVYLEELDDFMPDPLVRRLTRLRTPFNPFRDLARLRALQDLLLSPGPGQTRLA